MFTMKNCSVPTNLIPVFFSILFEIIRLILLVYRDLKKALRKGKPSHSSNLAWTNRIDSISVKVEHSELVKNQPHENLTNDNLYIQQKIQSENQKKYFSVLVDNEDILSKSQENRNDVFSKVHCDNQAMSQENQATLGQHERKANAYPYNPLKDKTPPNTGQGSSNIFNAREKPPGLVDIERPATSTPEPATINKASIEDDQELGTRICMASKSSQVTDRKIHEPGNEKVETKFIATKLSCLDTMWAHRGTVLLSLKTYIFRSSSFTLVILFALSFIASNILLELLGKETNYFYALFMARLIRGSFYFFPIFMVLSIQ